MSLSRGWKSVFHRSSQSTLPKSDDVIRFGILGTSSSAKHALIEPAKSHTEVVVQAVAGRTRSEADEFAALNNIPQVLDSYQAILDEPSINAVYISLPNSERGEWARQAILKMKHVLVESPAAANENQARTVFQTPECDAIVYGTQFDLMNHPVLMEAIHFRFHPAWQFFLKKLDRPNIAEVHVISNRSWCQFLSKDDDRYKYEMAGGSIMDLGAYNMAALLDIFNGPPTACDQCNVQCCGSPNNLVDLSASAYFTFANGATGHSESTLRKRSLFPEPSYVTVTTRPVPFPLESGENPNNIPHGYRRERIRVVTLHNFINSGLWNEVVIKDRFILQSIDNPDEGGRPNGWVTKRTFQINTSADAEIQGPQDNKTWTSHRYQLEEFVNRVKGRCISWSWISRESSILRAHMADLAYTSAGLPLRHPSNTVQPLNTGDS